MQQSFSYPVPPQALSSTNSAFLQSLRAKDDVAWRRVIARQCWYLYSMSARLGLNLDDADEVLQEVLLAASNKIDEFRHNGQVGAFRAWLTAITRNILMASMRKRKQNIELLKAEFDDFETKQVLEDDHVEESLSDASFSSRRAMLLDQILDSASAIVPKQSWRIFKELVMSDKPAAQVAKEQGVSLNQVYLAKSRTMKRLSHYFRQDAK